jgi:hypothetical protein
MRSFTVAYSTRRSTARRMQLTYVACLTCTKSVHMTFAANRPCCYLRVLRRANHCLSTLPTPLPNEALVLVSLADRALGLTAHDHPPWQPCPNTAYKATTTYLHSSDTLSLAFLRVYVTSNSEVLAFDCLPTIIAEGKRHYPTCT